MVWRQFLSSWWVDPVKLSFKSKLIAVATCFNVVGLVAWISAELPDTPSHPLLVASIGASAVIALLMPNSPVAQPWPLVAGQLISAIVGVSCAAWIRQPALAAACAVAGSTLAMLLLRCLHPPGAATALVPILGGAQIANLGYQFVWLPVGLNMLLLTTFALIVNRCLLGHNYPSLSANLTGKIPVSNLKPSLGVAAQDLHHALQAQDVYLDVTPEALSDLLLIVQRHGFQRLCGPICCKHIMQTQIISVTYDTEIEDAWRIMYREKLKILPVIDSRQRVIGILSWHDFFRYLDVNPAFSLRDKFQAFVKRTRDIHTSKPEAVGHVMSKPVQVLTEDAHIVDLIPLMTENNHRHIPIVDQDERLVGIIDQAHLIAVLYKQQTLCTEKTH